MVLALGKGRVLRRGVKETLRGALRLTMHLLLLALPLHFVAHLPLLRQRLLPLLLPDQWEWGQTSQS
jgi:hypothetical protein